jgi:hypothetical protein
VFVIILSHINNLLLAPGISEAYLLGKIDGLRNSRPSPGQGVFIIATSDAPIDLSARIVQDFDYIRYVSPNDHNTREINRGVEMIRTWALMLNMPELLALYVTEFFLSPHNIPATNGWRRLHFVNFLMAVAEDFANGVPAQNAVINRRNEQIQDLAIYGFNGPDLEAQLMVWVLRNAKSTL